MAIPPLRVVVGNQIHTTDTSRVAFIVLIVLCAARALPPIVLPTTGVWLKLRRRESGEKGTPGAHVEGDRIRCGAPYLTDAVMVSFSSWGVVSHERLYVNVSSSSPLRSALNRNR